MPNKNLTRKILHLHIDEHIHATATDTAHNRRCHVTALIQAMLKECEADSYVIAERDGSTPNAANNDRSRQPPQRLQLRPHHHRMATRPRLATRHPTVSRPVQTDILETPFSP